MPWKPLLYLLIAIVVATVAFFYFRETDRSIILKRFDTIMDAVAKPRGEGNIAMAAKHQTLLNLLDDKVEIYSADPPLSETYSAEEIMSHYVTVRRYCISLKLSASDLELTFPDETHAQLTCYGTARFTTNQNKTYEESRSAILAFVKRQDTWLLQSVKEHKVFK